MIRLYLLIWSIVMPTHARKVLELRTVIIHKEIFRAIRAFFNMSQINDETDSGARILAKITFFYRKYPEIAVLSGNMDINVN